MPNASHYIDVAGERSHVAKLLEQLESKFECFEVSTLELGTRIKRSVRVTGQVTTDQLKALCTQSAQGLDLKIDSL